MASPTQVFPLPNLYCQQIGEMINPYVCAMTHTLNQNVCIATPSKVLLPITKRARSCRIASEASRIVARKSGVQDQPAAPCLRQEKHSMVVCPSASPEQVTHRPLLLRLDAGVGVQTTSARR